MYRVALASLAVILLASSSSYAQGDAAEDNKARVVPDEKSISFNSMLIVEGNNDELRKSISGIVNDTAYELYGLLGVKPSREGARKINIRMFEAGSGGGTYKVRPFVIPLEGGNFRIELLVDTRKGVDRDVLQRGLIEVLIYELSLRGINGVEEGREMSVPPWLSYGLLEALRWKAGESDRHVYDVLKEKPDLYSVSEIFRTEGRQVSQFDNARESFFKASSCAFVMSLLRQKNGGQGMFGLMREIALYEGEVEDLLRKHFAGLNTGSMGLQKMWSLQVADMASPKMLDVLSIEETDKRLDDALFITLTGEDKIAQRLDLAEFGKLEDLSLETRLNAVSASRTELMQLSYRCFPSYRPILYAYIKVLEDISQQKTEDVEIRLVNLQEERRLIKLAGERARDYLDWYQITQAREVKGDFSGYMRLKERLSAEREKRKDPVISAYLDDIQKFFGNNPEEELEK